MAGPLGVPNRQQLGRFAVNREGWEAVRWSFYDFLAYPAAGATALTFFALPVGQAGKTLSDTNMTLAAQIPANQEFLVQSIEVPFFPTTPTVAAQMPAVFGAQAAALLLNDVYIVGRSGNLTLTIGSKPYLQEAPIGRFPPKTRFFISSSMSDQTTAGAAMHARNAFGSWEGRPYLLEPASLLLTSNQNFSVALTWPEGLQAISNAGRIGVVLDGILYRRSQ